MDKLRDLAAPYVGEWVLIRITRFDDATTTPLEGEVVCHGRDADAVYARAQGVSGLTTVLYTPAPEEQGAIIVIHVHVAV